VTRLRTGLLGFDSRQEQAFSSFKTASRPAVVSTQPPNQWASGALSLGVKQPRREAVQSFPSSADVENAWRESSTSK